MKYSFKNGKAFKYVFYLEHNVDHVRVHYRYFKLLRDAREYLDSLNYKKSYFPVIIGKYRKSPNNLAYFN